MIRLPTPPDALQSAARMETIRPTVSALPLLSTIAFSCSVMSLGGASGSCARQALHLLGHRLGGGDQAVEREERDQRGEDRQEAEERHAAGDDRHVVGLVLGPRPLEDLLPAPATGCPSASPRGCRAAPPGSARRPVACPGRCAGRSAAAFAAAARRRAAFSSTRSRMRSTALSRCLVPAMRSPSDVRSGVGSMGGCRVRVGCSVARPRAGELGEPAGAGPVDGGLRRGEDGALDRGGQHDLAHLVLALQGASGRRPAWRRASRPA